MSCCFFFFSSRRRHTRLVSDWSSDVCSSDLAPALEHALLESRLDRVAPGAMVAVEEVLGGGAAAGQDSVERVEEVGLVAPVGVEHGATAQARAREGKRGAGDVAHRRAGDLGGE